MKEELLSWKDKLVQGNDLAQAYFRNNSMDMQTSTISKVVFIGMGGSGVAGRLIKTFFDAGSSIPSFIVDSPQLPAYVDQSTLAIVVSYSGNTWETLAGLDAVIEKKIPCIVLTNGGRAEQKAQQHGLNMIKVPQTSAPRAALGFFLGIQLGLFETLGFIPGNAILDGFATHLDANLESRADEQTYTDFLELAAKHEFFHLWGVESDTAACMYRASTQFNENSKMHSVASDFPELCHNLLVGFTQLTQPSLVLTAVTDFAPEKLRNTVEITSSILDKRGVQLYKIPILGDTWENQLFDVVLWADFASYYLGLRKEVDITATVLIDELKTRIRG